MQVKNLRFVKCYGLLSHEYENYYVLKGTKPYLLRLHKCKEKICSIGAFGWDIERTALNQEENLRYELKMILTKGISKDFTQKLIKVCNSE